MKDVLTNKNMVNSLYKTSIPSPIGTMIAISSNNGICFLGFEDQKHGNGHVNFLKKEMGDTLMESSNDHLLQLEEELTSYFNGERKSFEVKLDLYGTDFQKKVWQSLFNISYGKTISYKKQSINIGNEKAIRAMASANGANKISIVIPCHRVIGSNGSLTGYASGIDRKKWLLDFERFHSNQPIQTTLDF